MKVYCDRLAEVMLNTKTQQFCCPKCEGQCIKDKIKPDWWDCVRCGRGWEQVPNHITTAAQAESYLLEKS